MNTIPLILSALLFTIRLGFMIGNVDRQYHNPPIVALATVIICPIIAYSKALELHWILSILLHALIIYLASAYLTKGYLTRFASEHGPSKDVANVTIYSWISFILGLIL